MPYLTRDRVRLYYEDHGQGLPILLSHGFGASTGMWRGQIEALQRSYRLIPWDMRGHGESDSPEDQALYSHQHTVEAAFGSDSNITAFWSGCRNSYWKVEG